MKKLLIVAYYFPPHNFVGAYRPFRFARYLSRMGWRIAVLSSEGPEKRRSDPELMKHLPGGIEIHRVGAPEAGEPVTGPIRLVRNAVREALNLLLFPDKKLIWARRSLRLFRDLVERWKPDVVMVTAPPYSAFLLGMEAGRIGIPWVADFRDAWVQDALDAYRTPLHRRLALKMERKVMESASACTFVNRWLREDARLRHPSFAHKLFFISNGYDPELLPSKGRHFETFTISYIGTLYGHRRPDPLIQAAAMALKTMPMDLKLVFVGRSEYDIRRTSARYGLPENRVEHIGFLSYGKAAEVGMGSDALWLVMGAAEKAASLTVPGKLYDYIGFMRPIIASVPQGAAAEIVSMFSDSFVVGPNDVHALAKAILTLYERKKRGEVRINSATREQFSIARTAEELNELLLELAG